MLAWNRVYFEGLSPVFWLESDLSGLWSLSALLLADINHLVKKLKKNGRSTNKVRNDGKPERKKKLPRTGTMNFAA